MSKYDEAGSRQIVTTYLSHPFILDCRNPRVGVTHHGNKQIHQKNECHRQEDKAADLSISIK